MDFKNVLPVLLPGGAPKIVYNRHKCFLSPLRAPECWGIGRLDKDHEARMAEGREPNGEPVGRETGCVAQMGPPEAY